MQYQSRTGPIINDAAPFSVEMAQGYQVPQNRQRPARLLYPTVFDTAAVFIPSVILVFSQIVDIPQRPQPQHLQPIAQTTHVQAPASPEMFAGAQGVIYPSPRLPAFDHLGLQVLPHLGEYGPDVQIRLPISPNLPKIDHAGLRVTPHLGEYGPDVQIHLPESPRLPAFDHTGEQIVPQLGEYGPDVQIRLPDSPRLPRLKNDGLILVDLSILAPTTQGDHWAQGYAAPWPQPEIKEKPPKEIAPTVQAPTARESILRAIEALKLQEEVQAERMDEEALIALLFFD